MQIGRANCGCTIHNMYRSILYVYIALAPGDGVFSVTQVKKKEWKDKLPFQASNLGPVTGSPVHQAPSHCLGQMFVSPFFLMCCQ